MTQFNLNQILPGAEGTVPIVQSGVPEWATLPIYSSIAEKGFLALDDIRSNCAMPIPGLNHAMIWQPPGNSTTAPGVMGLVPTTTGTATSRVIATTNAATRSKRLGYVSSATAGNGCGLRGPAQYTTGGAGSSNLYGFFYFATFVISDAATISGARMFVGLSATTSFLSGEPDSFANSAGLIQLSTDSTQLHLMIRGSSTLATLALGGTNFPISTSNLYGVAIYSNVDAEIKIQAFNLGNGTSSSVLTATGSTNAPSGTTLLCQQFWRHNNATALAAGLDICRFHMNTRV